MGAPSVRALCRAGPRPRQKDRAVAANGDFDLVPDFDTVRRIPQSGFGRELGMHAMDGYSEVKNVFISTAP